MPANTVGLSVYELRELLSSDVHLLLWLQERSPLEIVGFGETTNDDPIARWLIDSIEGSETISVSSTRIGIDGFEIATPRWARRFIKLVDELGARPIHAVEAEHILREARRSRRSVSRPRAYGPPLWRVVARGGPHLTEQPVRIPIRVVGSRRRRWTFDEALGLLIGAAVTIGGLYLAGHVIAAVLAGRL